MSGTTTAKTVRMIGPRPFLKFSKFRPRHRPLGAATGDMASQGQHNLRDWSRVSAPTASKRNVENLTRGWSPSEATFSKFCTRLLREAATAKFSTPSGRDGIRVGRAAATPDGPRQDSKTEHKVAACLPYVWFRGHRQGEGESEIRKTRASFHVGRPAAFTRPEGCFRIPAPAGPWSPHHPGGSIPNPSVRLPLQENHRWKITRGVRRTKTCPKTQLQMASMFVHAAGPPNLCQTTAARRGHN